MSDTTAAPGPEERQRPLDFVRQKVVADRAAGKHGGRIHTRFPPEPNGFLHIGHAKAICLSAGIAREYGGKFNLRFDDTNPEKEDDVFVEGIRTDVRWLGFEWDEEHFASDYFEALYELACSLIERGLAYVDDDSLEEIKRKRSDRDDPQAPGTPSEHRDRSPEENLDLFRRMRAGEFPDGARVLRAKIDMAAENFLLRDPVLYRIRHERHHRTGDAWCMYPTYDWAHGQSDAIEAITHSLCSLEFEVHRPLYDWFLDHLDLEHRPEQTEFARLNLNYTVMSKRTLRALVEDGHVAGWDDPRMPTLSAYRRRGVPAVTIRRFCDEIGVAKQNSVIDLGKFEHILRDDLNKTAPRRLGVLRPLKLVITNYPEGEEETFEAVNNPEDEAAGTRPIPFSRELWIERDDFMEDAPKKFFRLSVGREVRLRYACLVTCTGVVKDDQGEIAEVHCSWDAESRGGNAPDGRKVKGTIHWISARHAIPAEVRLYDRLFSVENPTKLLKQEPVTAALNPGSLEVLDTVWLEPGLADAAIGEPFQLERLGYFARDPDESAGEGGEGRLVFNRTIGLRDSWAKLQQKGGGGQGGGGRGGRGKGRKRNRDKPK